MLEFQLDLQHLQLLFMFLARSKLLMVPGQ
uniref:Uncharacterized protein n=1 Tax=Picea glauca TaxID=3330 RepID=A0A101M0G2_PICGL|nr:hypothetical protein ABT39_MTgene4645 [Picea glauca]QHR86519.1 hypothetical protein Q903MT_gene521 [Picea sitchensis]